MEVIKGLHKIDGIKYVNSYLLISESGLVAVDTGMPGNAERIISYAENLGYKSNDIKIIILTHSDIDHSGSGKRLRELSGAKIAISDFDAPRVEGKMELKKVKGPAAPFLRLMFRLSKFDTFEPDILLKDGDEIEGLKVIHTPGHTDGSISLYNREKSFMFVGDLLWGDNARGVKPPSSVVTPDMEVAWTSIGKILEFKCDIMLPGHGNPIMPDATKKVKELLEKHSHNT